MSIYKKILEFQKLGILVKKDGKNPHFKSSYATLNEVLDKVMKPLNDLGVIVIFNPEAEGLRTIIRDTESETAIEGFMRYVGCNNAQNLMACNTYFRRGSLVSMLGLEDEDDDGNKAVQAEPKKGATKPAEKPKIVIGTQKFNEMVAYINKGHTIEDVRKHYEVSDEVKNAIMDNVQTSVL